jgi:uncharacterized protein (TIRG00374 family)
MNARAPRNIAVWGLRIGVAAVVLWLAARSAPAGEIASRVKLQYVWAFAAAQPFQLLGLLFVGWRHSRLVGAPLGRGFRAVVLSSGLNFVFPARMAELLKATYLKENCGVPMSTALAAVVWERLLDLICIGCLAFLGLGSRAADFPLFFLVVIVGGVLFIFMPLVVRYSRRVTALLPHERLRTFAARLLHNVGQFAASRSRVFAMASTIAAWSCSIVSIYVLLNVASGRSVSLADTVVVFAVSTLGLAVPLLPGGLGTFEAAAVLALRMLGFDGATALGMALLMRLHQMTLILGGALYIVMTEHLGLLSLYTRLKASLRSPSEPLP